MRGQGCDDLTAFKLWKFALARKSGSPVWRDVDNAPLKELKEFDIAYDEATNIAEEKAIIEKLKQ